MIFRKVADRIRSINEVVLILFLVLIILNLSIQVVARSFFNTAFVWVEEIARYLFVWLILGSAALAYDKNIFVSVDVFSKFLSKKGNYIFILIIHLIELFFFAFVLIASFQFMGHSKGQFTPALQIPIGYIYVCFPLFFVQFTVFALSKIISLIRRGQEC